MALNDAVDVLIDVGAAKPLTETLTATGPGGSVRVSHDGELVTVTEHGKGGEKGAVRRRVQVHRSRLVAVIERPVRR